MRCAEMVYCCLLRGVPRGRWFGTAVLCCLAGCGAPSPKPSFTHVKAPAEPVRSEPPLQERDPLTFLRATQQRCTALDAYEVDFYRQERSGLFSKSLKPEEYMRVKFRTRPFSVYMQILTADHDFTQVVFVEGHNEGRMRCYWRKSLLPGLPPPVNDYSPSMAVAFGRSSSPITSFGVAKMMERVLSAIDGASEMGQPPTIEYQGLASLEKDGHPVHHLQVRYAPQTGYERRTIDLLIYPDSLLPAGCYCWLADGQLDAKYVYIDYHLDVTFDDTDFPFERTAPQRSTLDEAATR